jgi:methionine synthase I (cobalamin-dependent)
MRSLTAFLTSSVVIVGDGGMATQLQTRGLQLGEAPERWNLSRPEDVIAVHRAYADAGAQWLQTNTFGGTSSRLESCGLAADVLEVNREAVQCARAASGTLPVLGSVGPSCGDSAEWDRLFAAQCEALAAAKIEGYIVETIVSLSEGVAAIRAAVAAQSGPVIASFTPGATGALLDGAEPEAAALAFLEAGAAAVGVNCGDGPESLMPAVVRLLALGVAPVLAAPNAGIPVSTPRGLRYARSPDSFAQAAIEFQQIGVRMVAGCCGVAPEHIRAAVAAFGVPHPGELS